MRTRKNFFLIDLALAILVFTLAACQAVVVAPAEPTPTSQPTAPQASQGARLRITNQGTESIEGLVVLFPDQRIVFGDIPAGATTEYQPVEMGVYNYAAYEYVHNGAVVTQPVIDWVGETGKTQGDFTYVISYNPDEPNMMRITLDNVSVN